MLFGEKWRELDSLICKFRKDTVIGIVHNVVEDKANKQLKKTFDLDEALESIKSGVLVDGKDGVLDTYTKVD